MNTTFQRVAKTQANIELIRILITYATWQMTSRYLSCQVRQIGCFHTPPPLKKRTIYLSNSTMHSSSTTKMSFQKNCPFSQLCKSISKTFQCWIFSFFNFVFSTEKNWSIFFLLKLTPKMNQQDKQTKSNKGKWVNNMNKHNPKIKKNWKKFLLSLLD